MRVAVVQTKPVPCAIDGNVRAHETWIKKAATHGADMVFFPELSLTGYEPIAAERLALRADDARLDVFDMLSHALRITIGIGAPTLGFDGVRISMIVFRPDAARIVYSKQHLHADELPYFVAGSGQVTLPSGSEVVAPAICYESLLPQHCAQAAALGATLYVATSTSRRPIAFVDSSRNAASSSRTQLEAPVGGDRVEPGPRRPSVAARLDPPLSADIVAVAWPPVPLRPVLLEVRCRGADALRRLPRHVACGQAPRPLPPLGPLGVRSGAGRG